MKILNTKHFFQNIKLFFSAIFIITFPAYADSIKLFQSTGEIALSGPYVIEAHYQTKEDAVVFFEIRDQNWNTLNSTSFYIKSGSGTIGTTLDVPKHSQENNEFIFYTYLAPEGASWNRRISEDSYSSRVSSANWKDEIYNVTIPIRIRPGEKVKIGVELGTSMPANIQVNAIDISKDHKVLGSAWQNIPYGTDFLATRIDFNLDQELDINSYIKWEFFLYDSEHNIIIDYMELGNTLIDENYENERQILDFIPIASLGKTYFENSIYSFQTQWRFRPCK